MAAPPSVAPLVVVVTAMSSDWHAAGRAPILLAALGVTTALAGCDTSAQVSPAGPAAVPPPAGQSSPEPYDISRVGAVVDDFPQGFSPQAHPAKTLGPADLGGSAVAAFTGAQFDPPQCRSVVIPPYADPTVGTEAVGVIGQGDQGSMYVVALRSPHPVAAEPDPAGCDRISLSGSPEATGTVERIAAPAVGGVRTTGVKLTVMDSAEGPDYLFTAALDDSTSVVVMGSADQQLDPQRLMSDLLVKAVSAVRGQQ